MVKYSSSVLAAANLLAFAQALPAQPVCSVIVQVVTGHGVWVPQADPTWGEWADPSSKKPAATTTTTASWGEWVEDPSKSVKPSSKTTTTASWGEWVEDPSKGGKPSSKTTTTADWTTWDPADPSKPKPTSKTTTTAEWSTWSEDPSKKTTTTGWGTWGTEYSSSGKPSSTYVHPTTKVTTTETTTKVGGGFYTTPTTTPSTTTTEPPSTTTTTTTETTTTTTTTTSTTTEAPEATACPYYDGNSYEKFDNVYGGGSCSSSFTVHCGARAVPNSPDVKFWERHDGEQVGSLAECLQICDSNSECTAAIWTNYADAGDQDKFHCWQTTGLPEPSIFGGAPTTYGQLAYKGAGRGQCSDDYTTPQ